MWENVDEREMAKQALPPRERGARVELGAAGLHNAAEVHAARTHAFAVATHEAKLEVLSKRGRRLDATLVQRGDEVDATARRLGLVAGLQVRRTVRQTQSAMD